MRSANFVLIKIPDITIIRAYIPRAMGRSTPHRRDAFTVVMNKKAIKILADIFVYPLLERNKRKQKRRTKIKIVRGR